MRSRLFFVIVEYGRETVRLNIRARGNDEAMDQALLSLGKNYNTVIRIVCTPRPDCFEVTA